MQHDTSAALPQRPGDLGDPSSPHYPRPFNPTPPYAHGFPIEVAPVPIARWSAGNAGIPFLWSFEATRPGPHVALVALTHGEELGGSFALDALLREGVRPRHGRLSLLFNNWRAHERWDPNAPNRAFYIDQDMNRIWQPALLDGDGQGVELDRARELRRFVDSVDLLLDLHSTQQPSPCMALPGWPWRKARFAQALGFPDLIVRDDGPGRLRDWGGLGSETGSRIGLVVECGQHWRAETGPNALRAAMRLLRHVGMVEEEFLADRGHADAAGSRVLTVTHTVRAQGAGAGLDRIWPDFAEVAESGTRLGHDGEGEILTPYANAALIMPVPRPRAGAVMLRMARQEAGGPLASS